MYGYITTDNVVGQLFDERPADDMYHESFRERIVELPDGVTSGWQYIDGEFLPPEPEPEPEPDTNAFILGLMEGYSNE